MKTLDTARNNVAVLAIVAILSLGSLFMLANPLNLGAYDPPSRHGRVTHLVMFQFKDTAATDAIEEVSRLGLCCALRSRTDRHPRRTAKCLLSKDTCIDPVTQNPYIRSLAGGKSNSIEGMQVRLASESPYRISAVPFNVDETRRTASRTLLLSSSTRWRRGITM